MVPLGPRLYRTPSWLWVFLLPICFTVACARKGTSKVSDNSMLLHSGVVSDVEELKAIPGMPPSMPSLSTDVDRASANLPDGYSPVLVESARDYRAVVAENMASPGHEQEVWLFDRRWQPKGKVTGLSLRGERRHLRVAWDSAGRTLAVLATVRGGEFPLEVGLVEPSSTTNLRSIVRVNCVDWTHMLWAGEYLIVFYFDASRKNNTVLKINKETGEFKTLYSEDASLDGHSPIDRTRALLSPDKRFLAFSRISDSRWKRFGIWLLDLNTGDCQPLTYESGTDYYHYLVGWEGPDSLVFVRHMPSGEDRFYRARVKLPTETRSQDEIPRRRSG